MPELFDSPDYTYFQDFTSRAMVMQAWSSYGVEWPVIYHFLGVRPHIPNRGVSVIPNLPPSWPTLSVDNLGIESGVLTASASHLGNCYIANTNSGQTLELVIVTL